MKRLWRQQGVVLACVIVCLAVVIVAMTMLSPHEVSAANTEEIAWRISKAESLGLEGWIDAEGYLIESFFDGKSDKELSEMGVDGLIRTMTEEEFDAYVSALNQGIQFFSVTSYTKMSQVNSDTGGTLYAGMYEVDGILAFCVERSASSPPKGSTTGTPKLVTNESIRKVLYYGYNGPKDKGYTFVETAVAVAEANGDGDNSLGRKILAGIEEYSVPPSAFKVWKVKTNEGATQDLVYYTIEQEYGAVTVRKSSANTKITKDNACYTLKYAKYGLYKNKSCEEEAKVGTFTIKEDGSSNDLKVEVGTYYLKETKAPKGYALDTEIYKVLVKTDETTTVEVEDIPQSDKVAILIMKLDAQTEKSTPQGTGTLEGAQFTVKYYDGYWEEGVNPETEGAQPVRTWVFQTDQSGYVRYDKEYKVKGNALYKNSEDAYALPLGTLTIQETKASEGYRINDTLYIRQITEKGSEEEVNTYVRTKVLEELVELTLWKYQEDLDLALPNATFEHLRPDGTRSTITTNTEGKLVLKGLTTGLHTIRETKAPEGYLLNGNTIQFEIKEDRSVVLKSQLSMENGTVVFDAQEGQIQVLVYDRLVPYELRIHKVNQYENSLRGAEFTLYSDQACSKVIETEVTDEEGICTFGNLQVGVSYYLKETEAPVGYRIPLDETGNEMVYEIYEDHKVLEHVVTMTIANEANIPLPNTGSSKTLVLVMAGAMLCAVSLFGRRKGRRNEK